MFNRTFRLYVVAVLVVLAAAYFLSPNSQNAPDETQGTQQSESYSSDTASEERADDAPEWSSANGTTAHQNAEHHWQKHGAEFGDKSAEEYEDAAKDFVDNPPPGTEEKHRANGDTLYYNRQTNTFAVQRKDGAPRTMFKPDNGERYWDRQ